MWRSRASSGAPELAIAPANAREAALERRNSRAGVSLRREIEPDGFWGGRQLVKAVATQKGGELPPVGLIGPGGVFAAGGARVIFRGFGEPREARIEGRHG